MSRLIRDFRHALRACLRAPLVSSLAVVAFALGIGVTTGVFSIFYNVLLKPLPFPRADELVIVNDMAVDEAKTKSFALKMAGIGVDGKALLIDSLENKNAVLASRNNPKLNFVDALHVNVYDVVNSRYIVLSQSALDRLTEALSNER